MKILCIANQKGGVGKSIIATNLAHYLVDQGARVLLVDSDEQGHSSRNLDDYFASFGTSALFNASIKTGQSKNKLVVLHGDKAGLRAIEKSELKDSALVATLCERLNDLSEHFDFCIIDTAGSNSRVANAMVVASGFVVVPCMLDPLSIDVATEMLKRIATIQQRWNPALVNLGILPNGLDANSPAQQQWLAQLLVAYKAYMFPGFVSMRTAFKESSDLGIPVWRLKADDKPDGTKGKIKTTAREAGNEIKAVFKTMLEKMEAA